MIKTKQAFEKGKAFIPFITAGDPNLTVTEELILEMAKAGADLIELGIPFSDPVAEGLVIQKADERALLAGTTTDKIFDMIAQVRKKTNVPFSFMTYLNPIFTYGSERFVARCGELGVCALVVPDMPLEERKELQPYCGRYGVDLASPVAPAPEERIQAVAQAAEGFLYCVFPNDETIACAKAAGSVPCLSVFDAISPEEAGEAARKADGIVVESAVVEIIGRYGQECVPHAAEYVRNMARAIHSAE